MTHTYKISGMTCGSCSVKVKALLSAVSGVTAVKVDLKKGIATVDMQKHITTGELKDSLKSDPRFTIADLQVNEDAPETKNWVQTYKPILLVFAYILGATILAELSDKGFSLTSWMNYFMGGFFLVFSFFKMINLKGFAESYANYDVIGKKWLAWGYIYAFIELGLGLAYLTGNSTVLVNSITLVVMSVSLIGVINTLVHKRRIQCACLGAVFNLPMSLITAVEDGLMITMSLIMLFVML